MALTRRKSSSKTSKKDSLNPRLASEGSGTLLIIGGSEDKSGEMRILRRVAKHAEDKKMVVVTVASQVPLEVWDTYKKIFRKLKVPNVVHFAAEQHEDACNPQSLSLFDGANTVFFTGGDQLKITTKIGGTLIFDRILEIYQKGGMIAGTSAGAAAMGKNMLVGIIGTDSHKVGNWHMAPGLGFVEDLIIDQHFAQRGRIARLLSAVALNPGVLGVGIDEDTSILVKGSQFEVIGSNAVYIVDGHNISSTNVCQAAAERTMSMHDVRLHILAQSESFDLITRKPSRS
jgi:cyanophycinase